MKTLVWQTDPATSDSNGLRRQAPHASATAHIFKANFFNEIRRWQTPMRFRANGKQPLLPSRLKI
jgi:hypothetical protein